jgi:hypothetical protein
MERVYGRMPACRGDEKVLAEVRWRRRGVCWRCVRRRGFECFGAAQQAANHSLASASGTRGGGSRCLPLSPCTPWRKQANLSFAPSLRWRKSARLGRHVKKHLLTCCSSSIHHASSVWPLFEHHWRLRPSPCIRDSFNAFLRSLLASGMHPLPLRQSLDS